MHEASDNAGTGERGQAAPAAAVTATAATTITHASRARRSDRARSRLRHDGRSRDQQAPLRLSAARPIISARPAAAPNSPPIPSSYLEQDQQAEGRRAGRHDLHLPDASGDPPGRPRHLPDLRHGAGARGRQRSTTPPNPELADMTRRFWIGLVLALPVVVLEMGGHLVGGHGWIDPTLSNWIQFALRHARWCCGPAGRSSCAAGSRCVTRNLNMFTLIAMGTGVAYRLQRRRARSRPASSRPTFRGHGGAVAVYFEAAAVITVLVLLGQVLELRAREATSGAIRALLELAPKTARRVDERRRRPRGRDRQRCRSATTCACGPARRCRSTASSSKAAPRSTNRW